ncbi:hypothetical protein BCR43DRAFT_446009 [Syncephalastrum racemosum]|uniref:Uncharacterized protein n=1 Tax=Syncephalastrum racemosum TaxID=13706 RepID=A0A1X2H3H9_SYNRA|nr:hypothetical protein BCR43DRAFT_446009 [Syncephalastrum racemosum]
MYFLSLANLLPSLNVLDETEKEEFVATKINSIVTRRDAGTDEISTDEKVRSASRSFRQTFDVPVTERLVNCNSSFWKKKKKKEKMKYLIPVDFRSI